ncbi:MAG: roadblock/LC7 domain-containing protein [Planctomycetota bacterium]
MSAIDGILDRLGELPGVRGSGVATRDGMMVASNLQGRFREDAVSGLTSFVVLTTRRALADAGEGPELTSFELHATHGRLLIEQAGDAVLIVITDQFVAIDDLKRAVRAAAEELHRETMIPETD